MVPSEHANDPLTGRLLDQRYLVGARIARGGMASVYEAQDIRLDRQVAVKIMHPGLGDDDDFAQRFVREARAAARLNHPNVVGVYDQGDDDGTVFLVMEYVPGHTLRDVIRKEAPMPASRAIDLLEPVVSALAAAHRAGLIHRDVKPENVLIADESRHGANSIKVADFGLAKAISAETQHTATSGVLIGTVSYLAPELVIDGRADPRADVYAVGVVLYELLTGTKPHEGESPIQVAYRHVHHDVPAPSSVVPGMPDFVDALVARATSRDRSQRPADAGVLLHHFHRVAHALRDGVASDPELAADLLPRPMPTSEQETSEAPASPSADTTQLIDATQFGEQTQFGDDTIALVAEQLPQSPPRTPTRAPTRPGPVPISSRRRSVKGPLILMLSLLFVAGIGGGAWWFGWARYTTTPGVLGMSESAATKKLEDAGLSVKTADPAFSESVAKGKVIKTDPGPGGKVLSGGSVSLILSLGPERYDVPDLRGMTEAQAQDALASTRLEHGSSREKWSEQVPQGQVIGSSPATGTTLKPGDTVDLVLSKGRKPIKVKDWTGKPLANARAWLDRKSLTAEVSEERFSDDVPTGAVISQDPATGTLFRGDTMAGVGAEARRRGPELIEVPGTRARGVEEATEALEALGFEVRTEKTSTYIGLGIVYSSDPGGGEMAPKGSTITLYLL